MYGPLALLVVAAAVAALALFVGIGARVSQPWQSDEVPRLTAAEQVLQAPDAEALAAVERVVGLYR